MIGDAGYSVSSRQGHSARVRGRTLRPRISMERESTDVPEQIKRVLKDYEDGYRTEMINGLEPWLPIFSSVEELVFL